LGIKSRNDNRFGFFVISPLKNSVSYSN